MKRTSLLLFVALSAVPLFAQEEAETSTAYLVSNAHLDTQWNWDLQTSISDYVYNTINQNLILLEKFPNYIFNFEGGVKYAWMKEYYPREFEKLKDYVSQGRWHVSGASWEANDVIVPSVESGIRNILLGQDFYRNELGTESTDIFLPDCFGFGWTLPTIASHCGLIGFSSQKLGWRHHPFHGESKIPFTVGLWKGVDGSSIMMAHGFDYTTRWEDENLTENSLIKKRVNESPLNKAYIYYGTGDIGGSPTLTSVKAVNQSHNVDGSIEVLSVASDQLYKDFLPFDSHPELPQFDGELTMDVHGTGCYTSQAAMKLYNRQNELLGDAAERASVAAEMTGSSIYPSLPLKEAWRRVILHQFHDDLTGTSIPRAYEFSWNDELLSLKQFADILQQSSASIAAKMDTRVKGQPVVLFNALGQDVTDVVKINVLASCFPKEVKIKDPDNNLLKAQPLSFENGLATILVEATAPANGYTVLDVDFSGKGNPFAPIAANTLENSLYRLTFNPNGDINSLIIKAYNKEMVKEGKTIRLAVFEENESFDWPAWEILQETLERDPVSFGNGAKITLIEKGPVRQTLCIEKEYEGSNFKQYITLYEGELAHRIDFYNEIDWNLTNRLLKAEFPLNIENTVATYDLGIGTIERGNNIPTAYEVYSQRWADLTDKKGDFGLTIMNDCKYGWDKPDDNTLRLTLLHTPKTKNNYKYQNRQDNGYHTFTYSLVPHTGKLDNTTANRDADLLNQRVKAFNTVKHNGPLGRSFSAACVDNPNVAIKAFKKAENSDDYVVRVYEISGEDNQIASIEFPLQISEAVEADGTEKSLNNANFSGNKLDVNLGKNGIKTYKVKFRKPDASTLKAFKNLPLEYDIKCFSWNGFESDGDFSDGFSYAAELLPDSITIDGVSFTLGKNELANGKKCMGDTIHLPAGKFNQLHILAAAASEANPKSGEFRIGKSSCILNVPSYTGLVGQWGHTNHTEGFLLDDEVAYVGTHRHSPRGDNPYEFTYMFRYVIDIPDGAREIVLPYNPDLVIFSASVVNDQTPQLSSANELFHTSIKETQRTPNGPRPTVLKKENLLCADKQIGWSGYVHEGEHPKFLHDGDHNTKWCDNSGIPAFVDYDLGEPTLISGWSLENAAIENPSLITSTCLLKGRNSVDEEWKTIDALLSNKRNLVSRRLNDPIEVRYLRLEVIQPEQSPEGPATRIYEFAVY